MSTESSGYYIEDLDSLPVELLAAVYKEIPRPIATVFARCHKLSAWLGWRTRATHAIKFPSPMQWRTDDPPVAAQSLWSLWLEQLDDHGYETIGWTESQFIGDHANANLWMTCSDRTQFVQLNWTSICGTENGGLCLQCCLADGTELQTIPISDSWESQFIQHYTPDFVHAASLKTKSFAKLTDLHHSRLGNRQPRSLSHGEFRKYAQWQRDQCFRYFVQRGVVRKLSDREVRLILQCSAPAR